MMRILIIAAFLLSNLTAHVAVGEKLVRHRLSKRPSPGAARDGRLEKLDEEAEPHAETDSVGDRRADGTAFPVVPSGRQQSSMDASRVHMNNRNLQSPNGNSAVSKTTTTTASATLVSPRPSDDPTVSPTVSPTTRPTTSPSSAPSASPTVSRAPTTSAEPSLRPTAAPTADPSSSPTGRPTLVPTVSRMPTISAMPSFEPTNATTTTTTTTTTCLSPVLCPEFCEMTDTMCAMWCSLMDCSPQTTADQTGSYRLRGRRRTLLMKKLMKGKTTATKDDKDTMEKLVEYFDLYDN